MPVCHCVACGSTCRMRTVLDVCAEGTFRAWMAGELLSFTSDTGFCCLPLISGTRGCSGMPVCHCGACGSTCRMRTFFDFCAEGTFRAWMAGELLSFTSDTGFCCLPLISGTRGCSGMPVCHCGACGSTCRMRTFLDFCAEGTFRAWMAGELLSFTSDTGFCCLPLISGTRGCSGMPVCHCGACGSTCRMRTFLDF